MFWQFLISVLSVHHCSICISGKISLIMAEIIDRRRNRAPWLALLLAVAAVLSNAGFFVSIPGQGALVWVGLALAIAALVYAVVGVMRAFRQPQVYGGKVSSSILGVVALLLSA